MTKQTDDPAIKKHQGSTDGPVGFKINLDNFHLLYFKYLPHTQLQLLCTNDSEFTKVFKIKKVKNYHLEQSKR